MTTPLVVPPERQGSVELADRRNLAVSEWGPADGDPILFCTGAGMSGSLGFGAEALRAQTLRLIGIDRPGLGRSSLAPEKSFSSWTADVRGLIEALDLTQPAAVGFSQGAPFALALAHAGLVHSVAIVSGQDELSHPSLRGMLDSGVDGLRQQIVADPAGVERHVSETATADWLWSMISQMSAPADVAIYTSEPFATLYQQSLAEGFMQGASGYARDLTLAMSPWPFALEEIAVPVHLWYGALDTSPVHSPDHGAGMASRLPHSTRQVLPDHGSAILWLQAERILSALAER
ncbi:MAG TPA: alpha/beta hydrolase [Devosia sp.]|jgi:pimeloyl-ACP methyl ester carboxylesterase|uniref:alpha/beta fold hydrolase n=1 Tax=Devosia sp. TaxID=1871048 RepID=UPI002F91F7DF